MTVTERLKEIEERVNSKPGQETFDPAYMYKNTHADAVYLLALVGKYREALEYIVEHEWAAGQRSWGREFVDVSRAALAWDGEE